jgi:hypothetical protein
MDRCGIANKPRNMAVSGKARDMRMTPAEARFEIDRQLVALAAENGGKVPLRYLEVKRAP